MQGRNQSEQTLHALLFLRTCCRSLRHGPSETTAQSSLSFNLAITRNEDKVPPGLQACEHDEEKRRLGESLSDHC